MIGGGGVIGRDAGIEAVVGDSAVAFSADAADESDTALNNHRTIIEDYTVDAALAVDSEVDSFQIEATVVAADGVAIQIDGDALVDKEVRSVGDVFFHVDNVNIVVVERIL